MFLDYVRYPFGEIFLGFGIATGKARHIYSKKYKNIYQKIPLKRIIMNAGDIEELYSIQASRESNKLGLK